MLNLLIKFEVKKKNCQKFFTLKKKDHEIYLSLKSNLIWSMELIRELREI